MATFDIDIVARYAKFSDAMDRVARESERTSKRINRAFAAIRNVAGILGVALTAAEFVRFVKASIAMVDQLGKVAERTGIAVKSLSALRYAAALNNITFEDLTAGLEKFNREADRGSKAFRRIGVDLNALKTPEERLEAVAEAFAQMEDGAGKTAIAMDLFGRSGAKMIPLLNQGAAGLRKWREEAERLGIIFSPETARRAAEFSDNLTKVQFSVEALAIAVGNDLLPEINRFLAEIIKGREIFGSFSSALWNIGMGVDAFVTLGTNIANLNEELERLVEQRKKLQELEAKRIFKPIVGDTELQDVEQAIDVTKKQLEFLKWQQQTRALAGQQADLDANDIRARLGAARAKKKAPPPVLDESGVLKAKLEARTALIKQNAQTEAQLDDIRFARGEESIRAHFAKQLELTKRGLEADLNVTRQSIAFEQEEFDKAAEFSQERKTHEANLIRLQGQQALQQKQLADASRLSEQQRIQATEAFEDSIRETNVALLQQQGFFALAAHQQGNMIALATRRQAIEQEIAENRADPSALRQIDQQMNFIEQQARIQELLAAEETQRQETNTQIERAANARDKEAGSLEAELRFLDERNRILRESIPLEEKRIAQLEAEAEAMPEGPTKDAFLVALNQRKAALETLTISISAAASAAEKYAVSERRLGILFQNLATEEENIASRRIAGQITTQTALEETDAARRKYVESLRTELAAQEALARSRPWDKELASRIDATRAAINRLAAESNLVGIQMRGIFEDAFIDPFIELINQTKTADDALKSFFSNVAQSLLRLESQRLAEKIFGGILGIGGSKGSGQSILGTLFGLFGGGAAGAVNPSHQGKLGMVMTDEGPRTLARYAAGGIAHGPQLAMFGEGRMPEAYVPLPDGRSIPVTVSGGSGGTRLQAGPRAITKAQPIRAPSVTLQLHPNAMQMTLRDWFEGELARTMATR